MNISEGPPRSFPVEMDESEDMAQLDPQDYLWGPSSVHHSSGRLSGALHHSEAEVSLEAPRSLKSEESLDMNPAQGAPGAYGGAHGPVPTGAAFAPHRPHKHQQQQQHNYHGSDPQKRPDRDLNLSQAHGVTSGVLRENCSYDPRSGPVAPEEVKKTVSLPEEFKNVFITYSLDTARDMIPFTKFLVAHGFKPAIDIFDNPIRSLDTTKWMDRFLNDTSVLIIVVISPQYKEDVEGTGAGVHGLHTKYIHNQIQNEFIQQGCLNYRLVPVLFPGASLSHVPSWLRSTTLYQWPQGGSNLVLRLLRMERYIVPPPAAEITLTVRRS